MQLNLIIFYDSIILKNVLIRLSIMNYEYEKIKCRTETMNENM